MRHINDEGIKLIRAFEGFSEVPYICPAGYKTIGYGHVIRSGEAYSEITAEEGKHILQVDLMASERSVIRNIQVALTDNQFAALVSFVFNLGGGALQRSTLRAKCNRGDLEGAAEEFPKWCYAGGRKLAGLLRRRIAERNLFLF